MSELPMSEPHRLHPAGIVLIGLRIARELVVPAILPLAIQVFRTGLDFTDPRLLALTGFALLIFLGGSAGYGFMAWRRYTYRVEEGELRLEQGVITRQRRYIPIERIQALDLSEGVLQRILGVVSVRVETASGGGTRPEASISAVSREDAIRLQQELSRRAPVTEGVEEEGPPPPLRRLSLGDLLITASTAGRIGVAMSIVVSSYAFLNNVLPIDVWPDITAWAVGMAAILLLGIILVGITWLLGFIGTVLAHYNFTLTRQDDSLLIERGLLERRRSTIPIRRIQAIRIVENPVPQIFRLVELRVESAGYGKSAGESTVLYPMLRRHEVTPFLREIVPEMAVEPTLQTLPIRSRQRYLGRAIMFSTLISGSVAALFYPWGLWVLLLVPLATILGFWQFWDAGWAVEGDTLVLRTRSLSRTTAIVPRRRIQATQISSHPFQRRVNLATFSVRVASGNAGRSFEILHMDADETMRLYNWSSPENARTDKSSPAALSQRLLSRPVASHEGGTVT